MKSSIVKTKFSSSLFRKSFILRTKTSPKLSSYCIETSNGKLSEEMTMSLVLGYINSFVTFFTEGKTT